MIFAYDFRKARLSAGLSLRDAAAHLGVAFSTVCNWEYGRTEPPTNPVLTQDEILARLQNQYD